MATQRKGRTGTLTVLPARDPGAPPPPLAIRVVLGGPGVDGGRLRAMLDADPRLQVVASAPDIDGLVAAVAATGADVVLVHTDLEGGGVAAAADLVQLHPATHVVAVADHADDEQVRAMLAAGVGGFVTLDATAAQLCDRLVLAAAGGTAITPSVAALMVDLLASRLKVEAQAEHTRRSRRQQLEWFLSTDSMHLVAQPIRLLETGALAGYELLSRFVDGRAPDATFAAAYEVGLGEAFEHAVLDGVVEALAAAPDETPLSVNLTPAGLLDGSLRERLARLPLHRITVEVTEHAAIDDYEALTRAVADLRAAGMKLSVDDAGSGYASLRHVLALDPDVIKLDRSITEQLRQSRRARALTRALTVFAVETGAQVIAEGIETNEDAVLCDALGVLYGQGYALGRPQPLSGALQGHDRGAAPRGRRGGGGQRW